MDLDNPEAKAYLFELYTQTQGDTNAQVSMHDVGAALGLEKADAGAMAEDLFIQGYAELKTLSGGIGITNQGLDLLQIKRVSKSLCLGNGPILEDSGKKAIEKIIQDIQKSLSETSQTYSQMEELVMDMKTIEAQMLSPRPKTTILREILKSIHSNFALFGPGHISNELDSLIKS